MSSEKNDGWILEMLCGWKLTWLRTSLTLMLECTSVPRLGGGGGCETDVDDVV